MSGGEIWANMTVKEIISTDVLNLGAEHQCLYFIYTIRMGLFEQKQEWVLTGERSFNQNRVRKN